MLPSQAPARATRTLARTPQVPQQAPRSAAASYASPRTNAATPSLSEEPHRRGAPQQDANLTEARNRS